MNMRCVLSLVGDRARATVPRAREEEDGLGGPKAALLLTGPAREALGSGRPASRRTRAVRSQALAGGPGRSVRRLAAATQRLNGEPLLPAVCLWLTPAHAARAVLASPLAAFAIAVTHWLKGVPFSPGTCFLLSVAQRRPYALALTLGGAFGPGVSLDAGVLAGRPGVLAGL